MTSTSPPTPPTPPTPNQPGDEDAPGLPPHDELDALLRQWHRDNADKAAAGRDRLLGSLSHEDAGADPVPLHAIEPKPSPLACENGGPIVVIRRVFVNRYAPLAAAAILLAALLPFLLPGKSGVVNTGLAQGPPNIVMAPEGSRLDAFDGDGNLLGPCVLDHTDVHAEIDGRFARVTVKQRFRNAGPDKIEAVYTCPLGEQSTVDRLRMTVGDRVVVGEARERTEARSVYEEANSGGRVASILERERPNIFTQSVANVEPGASVDVEISYVEPVRERAGEYSFVFPAVVSPRYIPESARSSRLEAASLPAGIVPRRGIVLSAPATISKAMGHPGPGERTEAQLERMLESAEPIAEPSDTANLPPVWYDLTVSYPDESGEPAALLADGRGWVGGRWFYAPPGPPALESAAKIGRATAPASGPGEAARPSGATASSGTRSGQDLSVSVLLDSGGPAITSLESPGHSLARTDLVRTDAGQPTRVSLALTSHSEMPNRDFVLKWKEDSREISSRVLTHTGDDGNFFCVQLEAPQSVKDIQAVPREPTTAGASAEHAAESIDRLVGQVNTAVLTGVTATFDGVPVSDVVPDPSSSQELFVGRPITFFARYIAPGVGSVTFKGQSAQGPWSSTIPMRLAANQPENSSLPTLWARAETDSLMAEGLEETPSGQVSPGVRGRVVALGEKFNIATPFTSLVAVDDLRLTVEGTARLVRVPTELPEQNDWSGVFGGIPAFGRHQEDAGRLKAGVEPIPKTDGVLTVNEDVIGKLVTASNSQQGPTAPPPAPASMGRSGSPSVQFAVRPPSSAPAAAPASDGKGPAAPPGAPAAALAEKRSTERVDKLRPGPRDQDGSNATTPIRAQSDDELVSKAARAGGAAPPESPKRRHDPTLYRQGSIPFQERARASAGGSSNSMPSLDATTHADNTAGISNTRNYSWQDAAPQGSAAAPRAGSKDTTKDLGVILDAPPSRDASEANGAALQDPRSNAGQSLFGVSIQPDNILTLAAAQLAKSGRIDDAKRLACSNVAFSNLSSSNALSFANSNVRNSARPEQVQQNISQPPIDRLCGCLSSNLPPAERDAAVEEARAQASAEIVGQMRAEALARKLAPELLAAAQGGVIARDRALENPSALAAGNAAARASPRSPIPPRADSTRALEDAAGPTRALAQAPTLVVTILIADTSGATLDAIKALDAKIEAVRPDANVVVARLPMGRLEDLALLDAVRRVELLPPESPAGAPAPAEGPK